jgi:hypothetical protein
VNCKTYHERQHQNKNKTKQERKTIRYAFEVPFKSYQKNRLLQKTDENIPTSINQTTTQETTFA